MDPSMKEESSEARLYLRNDYIRKAVDLLCSGACYGGGRYLSISNGWKEVVSHNLSERELVGIASGLAVNGRVLLEAELRGGVLVVGRVVEDTEVGKGKKLVEIARVESALDDEEGVSLLRGIPEMVDVADQLVERIGHTVPGAELAAKYMSSVYARLGVQAWLLDQVEVLNATPVSIMWGLTHCRAEMLMLRDNVGYGLDQVAQEIGAESGFEIGDWEWDQELVAPGEIRPYCEYGPMY